MPPESIRRCVFWTLLLLRSPGGLAERVLQWEENFDGNTLNETVWTINTGNGCDQGVVMCGWGNFEQQTYTLENHVVADGMLAITAKREDVEVDERWYTSSRIRTKPPVAFLTGRIEARIALPAGLGLWAAFWMLPANASREDWAASGEIDIMEAVSDMNMILGTIHYGGTFPSNEFAGCKQSSGVDFSGDFHVYAIEWFKEEMNWYVDDQLYCHRTKWSSTLDSLGSYRAPFDAEFELLLNLAVGGSLVGRFVDDTALPATMLVDYIRVYNISNEVPEAEPFLGLPVCLPGLIEAEAYDVGGLGLGYGDIQPEGGFGTYRTDGLGLVANDGDRTYVANLTEGQWTAYSVMTHEALYDISLEVSSSEAAALKLMIGEDTNCSDPSAISLTGLVAVEATGGFGQWGSVDIASIAMPQGNYTLKLCVTGGVGTDVDSITFDLVEESADSWDPTSDECATTGKGRPYMFNLPWAIPGYIEAEYYDIGGAGVGFHETSPASRISEASTLRLPDGVDVIEAVSNAAHGHYVGNWEAGEWLAFTSKADQAGYWDFGASIASGAENVTIEFRILVDADNCSLPETDGFNGLGTEGFDLLDGPLSLTETGSWEAFVLASKEDVWVEEGEHRLLFCADSGMFNLNYLWFFTPNPTPSPTPAPTLAPTPAPQVPSDPGPNIDWIYLAIFIPVGLLAMGRTCCIVYRKETSRRKKSSPLEEIGCIDDEASRGEHSHTDTTPPMAGSGSDGTTFEDSGGLSGFECPTAAKAAAAAAATAPAFGRGDSRDRNMRVEHDYEQQQQQQPSPEESPVRILRRPSSRAYASQGRNPKQVKENASSSVSETPGLGDQPSVGDSRFPSIPLDDPVFDANGPGPGYDFSGASPLELLVSPVESTLGTGSLEVTTAIPSKPPRAYADEDVQEAGSLWDRSSLTSPLRRMATLRRAPSFETPSRSRRDQFEDALVRALDDKLEGNRLRHVTTPPSVSRPRMSRSNSFTEGITTYSMTSARSPMLAAGRCWMCQCGFENTVGQSLCLRCGRVAPVGHGGISATPTRTRLLPPHRMLSSIK